VIYIQNVNKFQFFGTYFLQKLISRRPEKRG